MLPSFPCASPLPSPASRAQEHHHRPLAASPRRTRCAGLHGFRTRAPAALDPPLRPPLPSFRASLCSSGPHPRTAAHHRFPHQPLLPSSSRSSNSSASLPPPSSSSSLSSRSSCLLCFEPPCFLRPPGMQVAKSPAGLVVPQPRLDLPRHNRRSNPRHCVSPSPASTCEHARMTTSAKSPLTSALTSSSTAPLPATWTASRSTAVSPSLAMCHDPQGPARLLPALLSTAWLAQLWRRFSMT